jgi:hypothetical protein
MLGIDALVQKALQGELGPPPAEARVSGGWSTIQRSSHPGRTETYRNSVLSLRVGCAVGSCSVELADLDQDDVDTCIGRSVAELLGHRRLAIRIAALDAYLGLIGPHEGQSAAEAVMVPAGTTLAKSLFRARRVAALLDPRPGMRVALVGLVNSLVQAIRERGAECVACDFNVHQTEWGDPVSPRWQDVVEGADAVLATGMTLSNATFEPLLAHARARQIPLAVYAQTGSAIVPRFLGHGVTAVSSEPFPFFSLHGGPTTIYLYRASAA